MAEAPDVAAVLERIAAWPIATTGIGLMAQRKADLALITRALADARREAIEAILPRGWYIEARVYECKGVAGNHRTCGCVRFVVDQRGLGLSEPTRYTNDEANAYFRALRAPAAAKEGTDG